MSILIGLLTGLVMSALVLLGVAWIGNESPDDWDEHDRDDRP